MNFIKILILFLFITSCSQKKIELQNNAEITSCSDYENNIAKNLIDKDSMNYWNSGGYGKKWIELNFKETHSIDSILFRNSYSTSSVSSYDILVKKEGQNYENIVSKTEFIKAGSRISLATKINDVKSIKLVFTNDSTWVAIHSIKIIGE
jgi:hypothetical protein